MPGYQSSSSETTSVTIDGNRLIVTGRLCFTYRPASEDPEARAEYLQTMARRRWKVGLRLPRGQELERFLFAGQRGGVEMRPDPAVTRELNEAFPCSGPEVWIGLTPGPGDRRYEWQDGRLLTICYSFELVLVGAACLPQGLVLVLTYADERFDTHYLVQMILVTDVPGARTVVSAIVDAKKKVIVRPDDWDTGYRAPAARPAARRPSPRRPKPKARTRKTQRKKRRKR